MRFIALASAALVSVFAPYVVAAEAAFTAPVVTVGRHLQACTAVTLPATESQEAVRLTLTSDDPSRLLLSSAPDQAGSPEITVGVPPRRAESREFCLQGLADSGTATYTIAAQGMGSGKGTVKLAPAAIVILGPARAPKFATTPHARGARLTVVSVVLDPSGKVAGEQLVAGGTPVEVTIANSNPTTGKPAASKLTIAGGSSSAATYFEPAAEGSTTLSPVQPPDFSKPAQFASVVAGVALPNLAIAGDIFLGKDLQTSAAVCLGEPAPPGGLKVTLTSNEPSKLLLSSREDQLGAPSVTVTVAPGEQTIPYYIQALGDSGEVNYTAAAPGFATRTATIGLTPSGVIVGFERYGPPEEGNVIKKGGIVGTRAFYISLADAKTHPVRIVAWTAYLDRDSGRAADITVQPLRPGVNVNVDLTSSNPAVGTVESPLIIKGGVNRAIAEFTPLSKGTTVISTQTPAGFSTPRNATSVPANVSE